MPWRHWATQQAAALGADPGLLLVAGDSAGGNLAAVAAVMARDRNWPAIAGQVLIYPVIAADFGTPSYQRFGVGYYNTAAAMAWTGISTFRHPGTAVIPTPRRCRPG